MNSGATAERVFDALKARIMNGDFEPGARLDPAQLASFVSSSVTPVRDALNVMLGERLIETRPNGGFYIPAPTQPVLDDLYAWSAELAIFATRNWRRDFDPAIIDKATHVDPSTRTARLLEQLAMGSANREHVGAMKQVNDRLHSARQVEPTILSDVEGELDAVAIHAANGSPRALHASLRRFHRRRIRASAAILDAMCRRG